MVDLGPKDKLVNIAKLKPYKKSKYSPPSLNAQATEFVPVSADCTPTSTTANDQRDQEDDERQGAQIEFENERARVEQARPQHSADVTDTHQSYPRGSLILLRR